MEDSLSLSGVTNNNIMSDLYKIIFEGKLLEGFDIDTVIHNLASISKMEKSKAEKLLLINKPTVLKKGLSRLEAEKIAKVLTKSGLQVSLKGYENVTQQKGVEPKVSQQPSRKSAKAQEQQRGDNPYAAPVADLSVKNRFDSGWLDTPKKVSASQGWKWISSAARIFFGEPLKWLAMGAIAAIVSLPILLIPILGSLLYYIPVMIFAGGFMIAAQEQMEGNALEIKYIFSGFRHNRNQLALLGVLYLVCMLVIMAITAVLFLFTLGAGFLPLMMGQGPSPEMMDGSLNTIMMFFVIILVAFGLSIPMLMAVWFSAPLVSLGNQNALQAFKLSFQACTKNMLPFLVYGLAFLVISVVFFMAFGILAGIIGFFAADGESMLFSLLPAVVMFFIGLPLMMITGLSVYTGFVDIFSNSTSH